MPTLRYRAVAPVGFVASTPRVILGNPASYERAKVCISRAFARPRPRTSRRRPRLAADAPPARGGVVRAGGGGVAEGGARPLALAHGEPPGDVELRVGRPALPPLREGQRVVLPVVLE